MKTPEASQTASFAELGLQSLASAEAESESTGVPPLHVGVDREGHGPIDEQRTPVGCGVRGREPDRLVGLRRRRARDQEGDSQTEDHQDAPHPFSMRQLCSSADLDTVLW